MPTENRFRDAASIHVDLPRDRVETLLMRPDLLRALDDRFASTQLEIYRSEDTVEVNDAEGQLHVRFRLRDEDKGTRVAAAEMVRPQGLLERTKHMLFPGQVHEELEGDLERLKALLKALGSDEGSSRNPRR